MPPLDAIVLKPVPCRRGAINSIIQVEAVTKQFRRRKKREGFWGGLSLLVNPEYESITAVNEISFQVGEGEIIGYIGPNGAGKSTSIKMLAGILVPTAGSIHVLGCVPHQQRSEHTRHIGVVFGQRTHLWWDVPVIDSLRLLGDIYKVPEAQYRRNLDLFSGLLGLNEFQNVPVRQLSLGSACVPTLPRPCCTTRPSCSSTNRPSGSTCQ